jgi:arabinofuranosyltransferase
VTWRCARRYLNDPYCVASNSFEPKWSRSAITTLAEPARRLRRARSTTVAFAADRRRIVAVVALMVPVIVVVIMGWQHRWTSDDGFINFRYVDQIRHGNGPVFNAGERVEAFTSPLWLAALFGLDLVLPLRLEWIAVVSGLALTATGVAFAGVGASRLWSHVARGGVKLPAGLLVFVAVPPVWDFATSGLDNSLGVAWLGVSWWALCRRAFPQGTRQEARTTTPWATCMLIGLGPLVRPDLAIMSAAFLIVILVSEASWRARIRVAAWALVLPLVYEVFRMAYYAAIVPNTALAKEAGAGKWARGWDYLVDMVQPYRLWIPLLLLVPLGFIPLLRSVRARRSGLSAVLIAAPLAASFVHAAYIVRVGGDFMHARMLLPSLFCLLLPVAVVAVRGWRWAPAVLLVPWILISALVLRLGPEATHGVGLGDERGKYVAASGEPNPVTLDDYYRPSPLFLARAGRSARMLAERGERGFLVDGYNPSGPRLALSGQVTQTPIVAVVSALGMYSYAAGPKVFAADLLGITSTIGSRFRVLPAPAGSPNATAGHDKPHRESWEVARFTPPDPSDPLDVRDARRSLGCGTVHELLDAVTGRFGPGRAWRNFRDSLTFTRLRVPEDPERAVRELCR